MNSRTKYLVRVYFAYPLWLDAIVRYLLYDGLEVLLALDLDVGQVQDLRGSLLLVQDVLQLELGISHLGNFLLLLN